MARDDKVKTDRELLEEIASRCRRTETRVTRTANHLNVDAGGDKPVFDPATNVLHVPTSQTSLADILEALDDHDGPVSVHCNGDYLATVGR